MNIHTNRQRLRSIAMLLLFGTAQPAILHAADESTEPIFAERLNGTSAYLADIGTIEFDRDDLRFRIHWRNDTGSALTIRNVQTLCQCASIKTSTDHIDRNEACFFDITWALEGKYGAFGTGFMLETEERPEPLFIQLAIRRPAPPQLVPESGARFGVTLSNTGTERIILVQAFDADKEAALSATRAVTCNLPFISGEVIESTNTPFRSPNTPVISHRHQLRVRLRCSPGSRTPTGPFSGTALVPIEYQGVA